jgi:uncharacterized protein YprB with RNaseH-like and TPR domain
MSDLKDRLNRFKKPESAKTAQKPVAPAGEDWERLGAHLESNEWGNFIMRRCEYDLASYHGHYQLGDLRDRVEELSCFHPGSAVGMEEMLFFDTETTGLGVGAGNVPFMVGIGFYTHELFIVEQLFIRNPSEELAMLSYLQEKLNRYMYIVSYNGRTFDWPILKNRYVLNRLEFDDSELYHMDFLYPSRSLWRNTLPSCRLSKVEEERLGFLRKDDVPGSMAPELYFLYLAEKDARVLKGVFIHNEHDIVTMAVLAVHFGRVLGGEISFENLSGEELYRTALWLEKMQRQALSAKAMDCLWERLMHVSAPTGSNGEILLSLAEIYKKKGTFARAIQLWEKYIALQSGGLNLVLEPYLELAMYYEHKARNYGQALHYTEEAWGRLWRRRTLSRRDPKQSEAEEAIRKRITRLQKKSQSSKQRTSNGEDTMLPNLPKAYKPNRRKPDYVIESLI